MILDSVQTESIYPDPKILKIWSEHMQDFDLGVDLKWNNYLHQGLSFYYIYIQGLTQSESVSDWYLCLNTIQTAVIYNLK